MNGGSLDRGPLQRLKKSITSKSKLLTALVESVLLRFVGFRTLLESELDIEVISASLTEIGLQANIDLALAGDGPGQNLFATIPNLKVMRPDLSVIIIGPVRMTRSCSTPLFAEQAVMCLMDRRPANLRVRFAR
jgi:hypothetical protein